MNSETNDDVAGGGDRDWCGIGLAGPVEAQDLKAAKHVCVVHDCSLRPDTGK